jgi:hypothetical protein
LKGSKNWNCRLEAGEKTEKSERTKKDITESEKRKLKPVSKKKKNDISRPVSRASIRKNQP